MSTREHWLRHISDIIRSQHYTRLGEGLGGMPLRDALGEMLTDIMHICHHEGFDFDQLLSECQSRCEAEEACT